VDQMQLKVKNIFLLQVSLRSNCRKNLSPFKYIFENIYIFSWSETHFVHAFSVFTKMHTEIELKIHNLRHFHVTKIMGSISDDWIY
jgi:hypothetical protein